MAERLSARRRAALADAAISADDPERLKAWWVYRMLCGPDPLGERLTLLWHDHFATSNQKVNDLPAMRRQNDMFRVLARAPFGELLERRSPRPAHPGRGSMRRPTARDIPTKISRES